MYCGPMHRVAIGQQPNPALNLKLVLKAIRSMVFSTKDFSEPKGCENEPKSFARRASLGPPLFTNPSEPHPHKSLFRLQISDPKYIAVNFRPKYFLSPQYQNPNILVQPKSTKFTMLPPGRPGR